MLLTLFPSIIKMEIEFVELEHRENVLKLMEICGVDMKEAYELYVEANYDFEVTPLSSRPQSTASSTRPHPRTSRPLITSRGSSRSLGSATASRR
jgi:hypothetical protein